MSPSSRRYQGARSCTRSPRSRDARCTRAGRPAAKPKRRSFRWREGRAWPDPTASRPRAVPRSAARSRTDPGTRGRARRTERPSSSPSRACATRGHSSRGRGIGTSGTGWRSARKRREFQVCRARETYMSRASARSRRRRRSPRSGRRNRPRRSGRAHVPIRDRCWTRSRRRCCIWRRTHQRKPRRSPRIRGSPGRR